MPWHSELPDRALSAHETAATGCSFALPDAAPENLGERNWSSQQPLVADGVLYTGAGAIHALGLPSGHLRWRCPLPAGYANPQAFARWRHFLLVAPQIADILVGDKALLLLDCATGEIACHIALPARQISAPLVEGDIAYVAGSDGVLYALDLAAQKVLWQLALGLTCSPFPPVRAGEYLVLPANDPLLRAVNPQTRTRAWSLLATGDGEYRVLLANDGSAVATGDKAGDPSHFLPTPAVADGMLFAANWNGTIYAIDAANWNESSDVGKLVRWRYRVPDQEKHKRTLNHTPVVAGGLVLAGSYDHRVHALDRRSGAVRWISPDLGRRIYSRPVVAGSGAQAAVYVMPYRRALYALSLQDGQPLRDAVTLEERGRTDLLIADGWLIAGGQQGRQHLLPVPAALSVAELLAAGQWPAAVEQLQAEGRLVEAAELFAEHQLYLRAGQLYREAGQPIEAANAFSRDPDHRPAWREAALLYQEAGQPALAAAQYVRLELWPAAAQQWERAHDLVRAAELYADRLHETQHAVDLFLSAGLPLRAAEVYERVGQFNEARKLLEGADPVRYKEQIQRLLRDAVLHGNRDALEDAVRHAPSAAARAELYTQAGEWISAADTWVEAGEWRKGAALLLEHDRFDKAIDLLVAQDTDPARLMAASQLASRGRFAQALSHFAALSDLPGQIECLRHLGHLERAADLSRTLAAGMEQPHMTAAQRAEAARWYRTAAHLFRESGRFKDYTACAKKARYLRDLPWLELSFRHDRPLERGRSNVLHVEITNDGNGLARQVSVELRHAQDKVQFANFRPIAAVGRLHRSESQFELRADEHGSLLVNVFLRWIDPDGAHKAIELSRWVMQVVDPDGHQRNAPAVVHVYQGDFVQGGDVYHGDVYRDHAYHQDGDRIDITRQLLAEAPPAVGRRCPQCSQVSPSAAAYCDTCGAAFG